MSSPVPSGKSALEDPRVYLAVERTFLAWIRTGLALMGFGFVVARFGLLLQELRRAEPATGIAPRGVSLQFGTALVFLGVVLTLSSIFRYFHLLRRLGRGEMLHKPSRSAVALAAALVLVGSVVTVYLTFSH